MNTKIIKAVGTYTSIACLLLSFQLRCGAMEQSTTSLYVYSGLKLVDSQWGKIKVFQTALADKLSLCGKPPINPDGIFGQATYRGIANLTTCPGYESFAFPAGHPLYGAITLALWEKLLPADLPPTPHERAFVMSLTHEGTDYDRIEWNYGTSDDASGMTWGPYGATAGHGSEVKHIVDRINSTHPQLLRNIFGAEHSTLTELMQKPPSEGYAILKVVNADPQRRELWKTLFRQLGAQPEARAAYDWYAFQTSQWVKGGMLRLYTNLIPHAKTAATEIDYAFFLDLAMHISLPQSRLDRAKSAIQAKEQTLGRPLNSSERRQVISLNLIPRAQVEDRLGRNVVYYVDGISVGALSIQERDAWRRRTGHKASECGLSDTRPFYPF